MSVTTLAAENERIVRDYVTEIWQQHRFERLPEFVADGIVYDDPTLSRPARGLDELRAHVVETESSFSDFHVAIDTLVADDDVVLSEWTLTATHDGSKDRLPPTDRRLRLGGMSIHRLEDGEIVEDRAYWDMREVRSQLGLDAPALIRQLPTLARRAVSGRR